MCANRWMSRCKSFRRSRKFPIFPTQFTGLRRKLFRAVPRHFPMEKLLRIRCNARAVCFPKGWQKAYFYSPIKP